MIIRYLLILCQSLLQSEQHLAGRRTRNCTATAFDGIKAAVFLIIAVGAACVNVPLTVFLVANRRTRDISTMIFSLVVSDFCSGFVVCFANAVVALRQPAAVPGAVSAVIGGIAHVSFGASVLLLAAMLATKCLVIVTYACILTVRARRLIVAGVWTIAGLMVVSDAAGMRWLTDPLTYIPLPASGDGGTPNTALGFVTSRRASSSFRRPPSSLSRSRRLLSSSGDISFSSAFTTERSAPVASAAAAATVVPAAVVPSAVMSKTVSTAAAVVSSAAVVAAAAAVLATTA